MRHNLAVGRWPLAVGRLPAVCCLLLAAGILVACVLYMHVVAVVAAAT